MRLVRGTMLVWLLVVLISGCAAPGEAPATDVPPVLPAASATPGPKVISIASGVKGGKWQLIASALADEFSHKYGDALLRPAAANSLMKNVQMLTLNKVELAFSEDYHVRLANQGRLIEVFPDAKPEKLEIKCGVEITRMPFPDYGQALRIVLPLYEAPLQIVTVSHSGVRSVRDLSGKRVSIGEKGSGTAILAGYVIKALKLEPAGQGFLNLALEDSVAQLKAGKIDAFFWSGEAPDPTIATLAGDSSVGLALVPLAGEEAQLVMKSAPGIFIPLSDSGMRIAAGTYEGVTTDTETLATTVVLSAMEDLPAETVRRIVETFFEHKAQISQVWSGATNLSPEKSLQLVAAEDLQWLHPGLRQFYKSVGLLK